MKITKRKLFRTIWFSLVTLFLAWQWSTFQSRNLPQNTFQTDSALKVSETDDYYTFQLPEKTRDLTVIFFQGGLADPKAYAPLCRQIAKNGYTCHLIKMAFRLPQNDYQKIENLFDLNNGNHIIGGHSQGAKMAAQFVYENPGLMKGLFLLGTSHPREIDLSKQLIPTVKLYAENDGLASVEEVIENKSKLPINSKLVLIKGGNHSQFGYLGELLGDDSPGISTEQQQEICAQAIVDLLNEIELSL